MKTVAAKAEESVSDERWLPPGVGAIGTASLLADLGHEIPTALLRKYIQQVKTGLPGMAYVQLDPQAAWPQRLQTGLVQ